ncbi:MAG: hypothetical protein LLG09_03715 [Negativicutes bacterium]|nr:hypothetical protein [Negativicutes bacterium]
MKRFWVVLICVVSLVITIGLVSTYWMGDYLFRNMLRLDSSEVFSSQENPVLPPATEKTRETTTAEQPVPPAASAVPPASPEISLPAKPQPPLNAEPITASPQTQPGSPSSDPITAAPPVTDPPRAAGQPTVTQPQLTEEEIMASVESGDKFSVAMLVLSNLTSADLSTLFEMVNDGVLTAPEKEAAKAICYSRFSGEDLQKVKAYYEKYKGNLTMITK